MARGERSVWKGMVAGAAAAVLAAFVASRFDRWTGKLTGPSAPESRGDSASPATRYALAAASGAFYGALSQLSPNARQAAAIQPAAMGSQLVHSLTTDTVRRLVLRAL